MKKVDFTTFNRLPIKKNIYFITQDSVQLKLNDPIKH